MSVTTWTRYTGSDIHWRLIERLLSDIYRNTEWVEHQALVCPYYVALEGSLGSDWGVIVNPESERFGLLTFEHDWCGCPPHDSGPQLGEVWRVDTCDSHHTDKLGYWRLCIRPAGHSGLHFDHGHGMDGVKEWRTPR